MGDAKERDYKTNSYESIVRHFRPIGFVSALEANHSSWRLLDLVRLVMAARWCLLQSPRLLLGTHIHGGQ